MISTLSSETSVNSACSSFPSFITFPFDFISNSIPNMKPYLYLQLPLNLYSNNISLNYTFSSYTLGGEVYNL